MDEIVDAMRDINLEISNLILESWRIYRQFADQPFLVKPSIPILFFGDSDQYFSSELKVTTLGLNPSRVEFPEEDRFLRFSRARRVYPRILQGAFYSEYLQALNGYFRRPLTIPMNDGSILSSICSEDSIAAITAMPLIRRFTRTVLTLGDGPNMEQASAPSTVPPRPMRQSFMALAYRLALA